MKTSLPALALLFTAACGAGLDAASSADELNASADVLVSVQRDERRCAAPACGGYWVRPAGSLAAPQYAAALDLTAAGLDAAEQAKLSAAPSEELLLKGRLGAADKAGLRTLLVSAAFRGMPGIVPAAGDKLFSMASASTATELQTGRAAVVQSVSVARAAAAFVDQAWLRNRIESRGAIASAKLAAGSLDASQVWLRLPEVKGPCAVPREQACGATEVEAYQRTPDRCLLPVGCVTRSICPMFQPACGAGYSPSSWTNASGCTVAACDPSWVQE